MGGFGLETGQKRVVQSEAWVVVRRREEENLLVQALPFGESTGSFFFFLFMFLFFSADSRTKVCFCLPLLSVCFGRCPRLLGCPKDDEDDNNGEGKCGSCKSQPTFPGWAVQVW